MAQNEVTFTLRITDNNTLQLVTRDAKKAAAGLNEVGNATNRAAGASDRYHRGQKGVAGAAANSTKNFSKMRDAMGGSSGLVGAYATLAANVFALSAAFNALNRVAKLDQLTKSIEFLSTSSGDNLKRISERLVEVTGNAITMGEALKAASFGTSAGFNSTQLENFAKIAKGAAAALNRDLTDSFDRLVRGVAKLEPEILDELGIIVRLDKAVSDYATSVGKSANELTAWERQQAFANATTEQGIKKYGALADSISSSPIEKLAASVENLSNSFIKFVSDTLKLPQLFNYLANNSTALTGAFVIFASTISKQVLPAAYALPNLLARIAQPKAEASVKRIAENFSNTIGPLKQLGDTSKDALGSLSNSLSQGVVDTEKFKEADQALGRSISRRGSLIKTAQGRIDELNEKVKNGTQLTKEERVEIAKNQRAIQQHNAVIDQATIAREGLTIAQAQGTAATSANTMANAINALGTGPLIVGLKLWGAALRIVWGEMWAATTAAGVLGKAMALLSGVISGTLTLLLRFLGPIGLIISLAPLIKDLWNGLFPDKAKKEAEDLQKSLERVTKSTDELQDHMKNVTNNLRISIDVDDTQLNKTITALTSFAGVMREVQTALSNTYQELIMGFTDVANAAGLADTRASKFAAELEITGITKKLEKDVGGPIENLLDRYKQYVIDSEKITKDALAMSQASPADGPAIFMGAARQEKAVATSLGITDSQLALLKEYSKQQGIIDNANQKITDSMAQVEKNTEEAYGASMVAKIKVAKAGLDDYLKMMKEKGTDPAVLDALKTQVDTLLANATKVSEDTTRPAISRNAEVVRIVAETNTVIQATDKALKGISDSAEAAAGELNGFVQGNNKFSQLSKALQGYNVKIKGTKEGTEQLGAALNALVGKKLDATFVETFKGVDRETLEAQIQAGMVAENTIKSREQALKNAQAESALYPENLTLLQATLDAEASLVDARIASQEAVVAIFQAMGSKVPASLLQEQIAILDNLRQQKDILTESTTVEATRLELTQKRLEAERENSKIATDTLNIQQRTAVIQQQLAAYRKTGSTELTTKQQIENIKTETMLKIRAAAQEMGYQQTLLDIEIQKFEIKLNAAAIEKGAQDAGVQLAREELALMRERQGLIAENNRATLENIEAEGKLRALGVADANKGSVSTLTTGSILPTGLGETFDAAGLITNAIDKGAAAGISAKDGGASDAVASVKEALVTANEAAQPFLNSLKELGPEGAVAATVVQGALAIGDAWTNVAATFEKGGTALQKGAAIAAAAGATIGAINQMLQANSQAKIAAIDQEIEAEQRRDGKSKESLAKIAALEKKKEAEKKKAFEMNKKMQMAQTIVNTASAMMSAIAELGPIAGPIMAAAFAAMGAAQLAIIAGTSYQGGGSSSVAGPPTQLAVGQRTSSIDMAKSKSTSGELAYLRGEQGMGGPESFRPAFTGMKYRASGGATTGFMVGEQGPELFIPDRPGTIVPADETSGMGGVTNVTFAISAIDTQGVEDMLENQKGTIINMIRQAANSYGQPFIEQVDTSVYRPAPKSRTYRR